MATGKLVNQQAACLAPLLCLCCELANKSPHVSGRKGNLLQRGQQSGDVAPKAKVVTLRKWVHLHVGHMTLHLPVSFLPYLRSGLSLYVSTVTHCPKCLD